MGIYVIALTVKMIYPLLILAFASNVFRFKVGPLFSNNAGKHEIRKPAYRTITKFINKLSYQ